MTTRPTIAGCLISLALVACVFFAMWEIAGGAAPSPWEVGETTPERTWWWGEVTRRPVVEGDGWAICLALSPGLLRCTVTAQGVYRRLVVDGVVWEDRRQRTLLPFIGIGRTQQLWLPQVTRRP